MAAISLRSEAKAMPTNPHDAEIFPSKAKEDLTTGKAGKYVADGVNHSDTGDTNVDFLVLDTVKSGQGCDVLVRGKVGGFDVSGMTVGDLVYVTVAGGALDDAAGLAVGKVVPSHADDSGKVIYFDFGQNMFN